MWCVVCERGGSALFVPQPGWLIRVDGSCSSADLVCAYADQLFLAINGRVNYAAMSDVLLV
jgi:hypothetical protein